MTDEELYKLKEAAVQREQDRMDRLAREAHDAAEREADRTAASDRAVTFGVVLVVSMVIGTVGYGVKRSFDVRAIEAQTELEKTRIKADVENQHPPLWRK